MRCGTLVALLLAGCLEAPPGPGKGSRDGGPIDCACPDDPCPFAFARPIRIDGAVVSEDLAQVPVLVRLETSAAMAAGGSDLRFTTSAGALVPHEIELFPSDGGAALVWLGVPALAAGADAGLCVFYGADDPGAASDPRAVWDAGFVGVWHLDEEATGAPGEMRDSSARGCDGAGGGDAGADAVPERVEGPIGFGQSFDGGDLVTFGTGGHLDLTGSALTMEAWVDIPALGPDFMTIAGKEGYGSGYRTVVGPAGEIIFQLTDAERRVASAAGGLATGGWHHVVSTYDGSMLRIFVDGRQETASAGGGSLDSNEVAMHLGESNGMYYLVGSLDEVRLSSVARSAAWIAVQRAAAVGALVSVGGEQAL